MNQKTILILVDGMRPDGFLSCGAAEINRWLDNSRYSLQAKTVMPSVTLPCHMSLFHSVDPERHGVTTNTYTPQVRPIPGLVEQLDAAGKTCAFFFTWEELRDLSRPDHLSVSYCLNLHKNRVPGKNIDALITDAAIDYIKAESPDFLFLYLGDTDEIGGHDAGWMGEKYLSVVANAVACATRVRAEIPQDYTVILTADHGGHGRSHGSDAPEDMTIPVLMWGPGIRPGEIAGDVSIKDIAPTVTALLGATPAPAWEGKSLLATED